MGIPKATLLCLLFWGLLVTSTCDHQQAASASDQIKELSTNNAELEKAADASSFLSSETINTQTESKIKDSETLETLSVGDFDGKSEEAPRDPVPSTAETVDESKRDEAKDLKGKPVKFVLEAFTMTDRDTENEETSSPTPQDTEQPQQGEEVWKDQTEEGSTHKRNAGRRFFSLMNLLKFFLNPVIEEFQEIEKSASSSDAATAVASHDSSTSASINSSNDVESGSSGNSSELAEKEDKKNGTESGKKTKFHCAGKNVTENSTAAAVKVVNSTVLLELLSFDKNHSSSDCVLVMFYAPWCHFCAATAPHYNAVARAFPQLEVLAVDTVHFSNLNARFGTVAVPNIMLFHQSRSAVRFNHTERQFNTLVQFISNTTGLEPNVSVNISAEDYEGPLSSTPTEETDYLLWFAWLFIIVCSGHIFVFSQVGQLTIERVMVLWQEHQHQHID